MHDPVHVKSALDEIATLLSFGGASRFKAQAYERAAELVDTLAADLGRLIETGRLTELEGIGASLERQIVSLWNTGTSELLEELRAKHPKGAAALSKVPGLTPRRIVALHEALGIDSLEALKAACEAHRVRALPGFGAKLEERLLGGLTTLSDAGATPPRLLLSDALPLAEALASTLREVAEEVAVAGALRRGEEVVDALELVVVGDRDAALAALSRLRKVTVVAAEEGRALVDGGIPLRLHFTKRESVGTQLLLATGSTEHLARLGARAKASTAGALAAHAASERAIYAALGLAFVPPELRAGGDEVEAAAREDFEDLVEAGDIRGMVHCHTTYSDGRHSIEQMARAAEALGMQYITITDHSPSAHYARGVTLDRLKRQWDEIREVQERVGVRILRGTESDILADGSLDYPDDVLAQLDVVIASVHARYRLGRAEMTARLVRAMKLPVFKIWGHALGRLLLRRDPIDCDVEAVLDALAGARGAIEINGDPRRLDLPPRWIPAARARGIPFVLSVDAHSTEGLSVLPHAATMARRGGLRRAEVLNTLPADAFAERVRPVA